MKFQTFPTLFSEYAVFERSHQQPYTQVVSNLPRLGDDTTSVTSALSQEDEQILKVIENEAKEAYNYSTPFVTARGGIRFSVVEENIPGLSELELLADDSSLKYQQEWPETSFSIKPVKGRLPTPVNSGMSIHLTDEEEQEPETTNDVITEETPSSEALYVMNRMLHQLDSSHRIKSPFIELRTEIQRKETFYPVIPNSGLDVNTDLIAENLSSISVKYKDDVRDAVEHAAAKRNSFRSVIHPDLTKVKGLDFGSRSSLTESIKSKSSCNLPREKQTKDSNTNSSTAVTSPIKEVVEQENFIAEKSVTSRASAPVLDGPLLELQCGPLPHVPASLPHLPAKPATVEPSKSDSVFKRSLQSIRSRASRHFRISSAHKNSRKEQSKSYLNENGHEDKVAPKMSANVIQQDTLENETGKQPSTESGIISETMKLGSKDIPCTSPSKQSFNEVTMASLQSTSSQSEITKGRHCDSFLMNSSEHLTQHKDESTANPGGQESVGLGSADEPHSSLHYNDVSATQSTTTNNNVANTDPCPIKTAQPPEMNSLIARPESKTNVPHDVCSSSQVSSKDSSSAFVSKTETLITPSSSTASATLHQLNEVTNNTNPTAKSSTIVQTPSKISYLTRESRKLSGTAQVTHRVSDIKQPSLTVVTNAKSSTESQAEQAATAESALKTKQQSFVKVSCITKEPSLIPSDTAQHSKSQHDRDVVNSTQSSLMKLVSQKVSSVLLAAATDPSLFTVDAGVPIKNSQSHTLSQGSKTYRLISKHKQSSRDVMLQNSVQDLVSSKGRPEGSATEMTLPKSSSSSQPTTRFIKTTESFHESRKTVHPSPKSSKTLYSSRQSSTTLQVFPKSSKTVHLSSKSSKTTHFSPKSSKAALPSPKSSKIA